MMKVEGSLTPLNYHNGGPLLVKGDPAICAQQFIGFLSVVARTDPQLTYQFSMDVFREARRHEFLPIGGAQMEEPDDRIAFTFKGDEVVTKMTRELSRVIHNEVHGVLLWNICLRLEAPPVAGDSTMIQTNINERCPPLSVREYIALVNKFHNFQTSALSHVAAGSPRLGLNDSFMSRVALIEMRDYINTILERK